MVHKLHVESNAKKYDCIYTSLARYHYTPIEMTISVRSMQQLVTTGS